MRFDYTFTFPDGGSQAYRVVLADDLSYCQHGDCPPPAWAMLATEQCRHCQLAPDHRHCPVAVNVAELVAAFHDTASYRACLVSCHSAARTVSKETTVQDGLSSIMGIIMATSGCPSLAILKPLARFHLPFATVEESLFRAVSAYLVRQYFVALDGGQADFELTQISRAYEAIQEVNAGILRRIQHAVRLDADRNAIVILNSLVQILEMEIADKLESLRPLFTRS